MRRLVLALVAVGLLATTTACSSSSTPPAKLGTPFSIHVTGPTNAVPVVSFKAPLRFAQTASRLVTKGPGTGPAVSLHSLVTVQFVGINATDETVFGSSWKTGPQTFYVSTVVKGFARGLVGHHAGDRVVITSPSRDAFGVTGNLEASVQPGDSVLFVVDILNVAKENPLPATVPQLEYDASGNPKRFTATDTTTDKPTKLGVYPIVEGKGPVVKKGAEIAVDYFGQIYPDGNVFNSWTGDPFTTQIGAGDVIKGWDVGLVGQRVGSRIVLVIPPAYGYKDKKQAGIPANSTLIFVVQIMSVK